MYIYTQMIFERSFVYTLLENNNKLLLPVSILPCLQLLSHRVKLCRQVTVVQVANKLLQAGEASGQLGQLVVLAGGQLGQLAGEPISRDKKK